MPSKHLAEHMAVVTDIALDYITSSHTSLVFMQLERLKAEIEDPELQYPAYYCRKFHGYDDGNLDWQAACELESATASLALRIIM